MIDGSGERGEILIFLGPFGFSDEDGDFIGLRRFDADLITITLAMESFDFEGNVIRKGADALFTGGVDTNQAAVLGLEFERLFAVEGGDDVFVGQFD